MKKKLKALQKYLKIFDSGSPSENSASLNADENINVFDKLLEKSNKLETFQKVSPRKEFVDRSKDRIFNQLMETQKAQSPKPSIRPQRRSLIRTFVASPAFSIFILLILGFGFVGSVQAADTASPGDLFYFLDLAVENAQIHLALDDIDRTELYLQNATERLMEAQINLSRGEMENADIALAGYKTNITMARGIILAANSDIQAKLFNLVTIHYAVQNQILNQLVTSDIGESHDALVQAMAELEHALIAFENIPGSTGTDIVVNSQLKFAADLIVNLKEVEYIDTDGDGTPDTPDGDWLPPGIIDNPQHQDDLPPGLQDKPKPPGQKDKKNN
jgi:hypothetical protein